MREQPIGRKGATEYRVLASHAAWASRIVVGCQFLAQGDACLRYCRCMANTITLPKSSMTAPLKRKLPRLRLLYTPAEGIVQNRVYSLLAGQTWLGRELPPEHPGVLVTGDARMSGVHALIEVSHSDPVVKIADWRSKNGTWLGDHRLSEPKTWHPVEDGDLVRIGETFFLLRFELSQTPDAEISAIVGISPAIRELRAGIARMAAHAAPVLLSGETGTGKEAVARALHALSRRSGAFVPLNTAAIPTNLAESEFFGHAQGAFTGARTRQGSFKSADRGTVFLDEIGDMPIELQSKLLRVLEDGVVTSVGSDRSTHVDVRVIAATNKDLRRSVEKETFREDLLARLAHFQLKLPTLRARREDILLLLRAVKPQTSVPLTPDLVQDLLLYDWPWNVRELVAIKERLLIEGYSEPLREELKRGSISVTDEQVPAQHLLSSSITQPRQQRVLERSHTYRKPSKEEIISLLQTHHGNVSPVADAFNVARKTVSKWIVTYGINVDDFRTLPQ